MGSHAIPATTRKTFLDDGSEMPAHLSSTPGGTLYSTTPGGTRLVYEKSVLMSLRNSPISKTPPTYVIPESLIPRSHMTNHKHVKLSSTPTNGASPMATSFANNHYDHQQDHHHHHHQDQHQFDIDL